MDVMSYGAASRAAIRELGGIFRPQRSVVSVGILQVLAVPYNPNRIGLVVVNAGTTNITLDSEPGIVAGTGLLLLGNGAVMSMNMRDDADVVSAAFYAIGDIAAGSLFVFEEVQTGQTKEA